MSRPTRWRWGTSFSSGPASWSPATGSCWRDARTWTPPASPASRCRSRPPPGTRLLSGSLNLDGPLTIRATAPASESQYARIVELVRTAQESKSPLQRLADRYAVWFTPLHAPRLRRRVPGHRGSGPGARRARRGDAVPAHPRHACRRGGRDQPGGAARDHLPPRLGARAARRNHRGRLRQDRNAHDRPAARRAGAGGGAVHGAGGAAAGGRGGARLRAPSCADAVRGGRGPRNRAGRGTRGHRIAGRRGDGPRRRTGG